MFLKQLRLNQFKTYTESIFDFNQKVNCLTGKNGIGKTNVLDAIYYLSFCKSFFNSRDSQNIQFDKEEAFIHGSYISNNSENIVACNLNSQQKKVFKFNNTSYNRLSDHIGLIPLVLLSPTDTNLITLGSEERRKYMDGVISQFDSNYLQHLLNYNKSLLQRNALLKNFAENNYFDPISLEIWNAKLLEHGNYIYQQRLEFLNNFIPIVNKYYQFISSEKENINIEYKSDLNEEPFDTLLENCTQKDKAARHSTKGIHKDDLEFHLEGRSIKRFGSQGQQKSFVVALKLGQFDLIKEKKQENPLLLLDDIFDKLDIDRIKNLMKLVSDNHFGQIFITDTQKERIELIFSTIETEYEIFEIDKHLKQDD